MGFAIGKTPGRRIGKVSLSVPRNHMVPERVAPAPFHFICFRARPEEILPIERLVRENALHCFRRLSLVEMAFETVGVKARRRHKRRKQFAQKLIQIRMFDFEANYVILAFVDQKRVIE
ncbi:MAG: hypothetical protein AAGJ87_16350 [Pseudomonadota bacterium]